MIDKQDHAGRTVAGSQAAALLRQCWPGHEPSAADVQKVSRMAKRFGDRRVCAMIHAHRTEDRFADSPDLGRIGAMIDRALHGHYSSILQSCSVAQRSIILRAYGAAGPGTQQAAFTRLARANPLGLTCAALDRGDHAALGPALVSRCRRRLQRAAA